MHHINAIYATQRRNSECSAVGTRIQKYKYCINRALRILITVIRAAARICLKGGKPLSVIIGEEKHGHVINPLRAVASVEPGARLPLTKCCPPPPRLAWGSI